MKAQPNATVRYAAYRYSVESSAVSEAMSGMMFLSMNAR
jgi:hypothetical protein